STVYSVVVVVFFSSRRRHTRSKRDWSSDVCSSDLFKDVYQIDGGIVRYGEKYGNEGLWEGSMYVFDKRMHHEFGAGVNDPGFIQLGHCVQCGAGTNTFVNCVNEDTCRQQVLLCDDCASKTSTANCGREDCQQVAAELEAAEK